MKLSMKTILLVGLLTFCLTAGGALAQTNSNITSVTSPTNVNLNSVAIIYNSTTNPSGDLSELNAWAVGDGGTIATWNGNSWTTVNSPTTENLHSVVFINATEGWAVGGSSNTGVILHYNGTWGIWNQISMSGNPSDMDTLTAPLYGVTVDSTGTVGWAVGANGLVLGWNGQSWYGFTSVTPNTLHGVGMVHGSADAWAVGEGGTIVHWDGTQWTNVNSPTIRPLYGIEMINATSGWAVGGTDTNGVILMMSGTTWNVQNNIDYGGATNQTTGSPTDTINATLYSVSMNTPDSAWAVGSNGNVLYWTGTEWAGQTNVQNGVTLRGVSMVHGVSDSTQAWAVGDQGTILAWTGTAWVPEFPLLIVVPVLIGVGLVFGILKKAKLRMLLK
jgi:hypothetical protein